MKRKIVFISLLTLCLSVSAQQAKEDIRLNRLLVAGNNLLVAGNYLAYPGPLQKSLTRAPKGYKPFYLSHYGRHGSRWLIGDRDYNQPVLMLERADSLGKLTPKGQEVLRDLRLLRDAAKGRDGELTPLGAEQHRQIAERMVRNFPEIFKGKTHVDAKSTVVIRCILSMENALQQLVRMNPNLEITHDASYHDMYYMNHNDTSLFKQRMPKAAREAFDNFSKRHIHPERLMNDLFNDSTYWQKEINLVHFSSRLLMFRVLNCVMSSHCLTFLQTKNSMIFGPQTMLGGISTMALHPSMAVNSQRHNAFFCARLLVKQTAV